jgi:hypothetical protein
MERQEIIKTLAVVKIAYPNSFNKMTSQDFETLINLWGIQFKNYSYELVMNAINTIIANDINQFMPTIGKIKEVCNQLMNPNRMCEEEAWLYIEDAMRNGIYGSVKEFNNLPSECQRIVGNPDRLRNWAMMDIEEVQTVVHSNFLKAFRNQQEQDKTRNAISFSENLMIGEEND